MKQSRINALIAVALVLAFLVISLGVFTRLSHAGLSCPDWPACYGKVSWPQKEAEIKLANETFPDRPVETSKAWKEMVHRYAAGLLMLAVFSITFFALKNRTAKRVNTRLFVFISLLISLQAILGMWTVTWKLKPIVVMAHLLGGFSTLCLLGWAAVRNSVSPISWPNGKVLVWGALLLVGTQAALGGWLSANYAALACGLDYPQCLGQWLPATDFREGFILWRGIGLNYEGGVLDSAARVSIHLSHRWFALLVSVYLLFVIRRCLKVLELRKYATALLFLLILQISLGILNVKMALPLTLAVAHHAVAALLLLLLVALLAKVTR
jgi:cytochrome c oxidase assembly protein subunit 15